MSIGIINFGMGNLGSVQRAFHKLGIGASIIERPKALESCDRIVLPGVGSFADGSRNLLEQGWAQAIHMEVGRGKPLLGICLGMQLLADSGCEGGEHPGLGLVCGQVVRLDGLGCQERIPHVGWNSLELTGKPDPLLEGIQEGADVYFVHSYAFSNAIPEDVSATVSYGARFPAMVRSGLVFGTQFHPEKSSRVGLRMLENFARFKPC